MFKWVRLPKEPNTLSLNIPQEEDPNPKRADAANTNAHAKATTSISVFFVALLLTLILAQQLWKQTGTPWDRASSEFIKLSRHSNYTIAAHLRRLTAQPHVAGTPENMATADYVLSCFLKYGLSSHFRDYDVLLSYPLHRSVFLTTPDGRRVPLEMQESAFPADAYSQSTKVVPGFHAYSPSGSAVGEPVYANYGRKEDFAALEDLGVSVKGTIVLARHGRIFRGDIVKNAAAAGAAAVLTYSDPRDSGGGANAKSYPESKWLPLSGIQRGTVLDVSGDLLTPGWAATTGAERLSESDIRHSVFPKIPSLPLSAEDALVILRSLGGPAAPVGWHGDLDVSPYRVGRGPSLLNFTYLAEDRVTRIRNVLAVINGNEEADRYVLLGNHRDAWTFGAVDPNSGTAALLQIAERMGKLLKRGWRPRRSIILCSWDAEEYGSIGSTEWVEENFEELYSKAVAYVNVDCAVSGPGFTASATPQLDNILFDVTKILPDPEDPSLSIFESWASSAGRGPMVGRLGGWGSDFSAFLHHVGVPAMDIYFGGDYPVYHSLYDNYLWMEKFGDPLFSRHVAVVGVWGLVAIRLADDPSLPLDYSSYADHIQTYVDAIEAELKGLQVTTFPLQRSISRLKDAATKLEEERKQNANRWTGITRLNKRLMMTERALTDTQGVPGKTWYRHVIYGPSSVDGYASSTFPGIVSFLEKARSNASKELSSLQHQIWKVSRALDRAAALLAADDSFLQT